MHIEELLQQASRLFPFGTIYASAGGDTGPVRVNGAVFLPYINDIYPDHRFAIIEASTRGLIHVDGHWGRIIEKGIVNNYDEF